VRGVRLLSARLMRVLFYKAIDILHVFRCYNAKFGQDADGIQIKTRDNDAGQFDAQNTWR
jgi:hypothetical protein